MKRTKLPDKNSFDFVYDITVGRGLSGKFLCPPFSILHTSSGEWQRRKKQWLALGIKSEIGRDGGLLAVGQGDRGRETDDKWEPGKKVWLGATTSVFDPVLCELMYAWFCPIGGQIVDPFAGGSVRGIVAHKMGMQYWGSELREEQVEANITQGNEITPDNKPTWVCGDAMHKLSAAPQADFLFTCPPYGDLEVYSDLEDDLSNKTYDTFLEMYRRIIRRSCSLLKEDRFACFVVMNYRDKKTGYLRDFVGDTIRCFEPYEVKLYNNIVLATSIGSLPIRTGRTFSATRKVGSAHQMVLVFYKGDWNNIRKIYNT